MAADRAAKALTNLLLQDLVGEGLPPEVAAEFIAHRKRHKAPITPLAWKLIRHAAEKAGWPIDQAVAKMIARGWRGLEASWLMREQVDLQGLQQSASGETPKQRAARERAAEICPAVARAAPDGSPTLATSRFAPGPRAPFVQRPAQVAEDIPYTEKRSIVK